MKEILFIRKNIAKWREMEEVAQKASSTHPDVLADTYNELTADLSFSQTHYPHSRITIYLNNLASTLHNAIYRNKREKWTRIITYWTQEIPTVMAHSQKELRLSFIIFFVSMILGAVSAANDDGFVRLLLGNSYVDMTLANIEAGNPMGVYGHTGEVSMFMQITFNNILVSFNIFVAGILTSIFSGYMLFYNGIILGSFLTFFHQHSLLGEASLAVWLHGTLEISAIIIAGAAGITLGNGWLFPGTYSRMTSFRHGAKRGLKILISTVPLFVIAGFIESFLTRHTHLHNGIRLGVILLSLAFILYYYIYLPNTKRNGAKNN